MSSVGIRLKSVVANRRGCSKALSEMFQAQNLFCNVLNLRSTCTLRSAGNYSFCSFFNTHSSFHLSRRSQVNISVSRAVGRRSASNPDGHRADQYREVGYSSLTPLPDYERVARPN